MVQLLDHTIAYWEKPDQVIWVQTPKRRLQGSCYFFVGSDTYGAWFDPSHNHDYAGPSVAYRLHLNGKEERIPFAVPMGAAVYKGYQLTDEQARFVGVL